MIRMQKLLALIFLAALAAALFLRLPQLAARPMHHDEANQASRFGLLLESGEYRYDPDDHHGPTLYYLTLPVAWISGAKTYAATTEVTFRILPVLFGIGLILLTPMLRSGIGCIAVAVTALLTAVSPAMVYYSRFYIQEMLLVFFTLLMLASGWLAWTSGLKRWAVIGGIAAGLMFATKETAIITYAAICGSVAICALFGKDCLSAAMERLKQPGSYTLLLVAAASAAFIAFLLFSSFFTNPEGPLQSILAFKGYLARGAGVDTDHVHPWNFYLKMLTFYRSSAGPFWSEGLAFGLGLIGAAAILLKKVPEKCDLGFARFLLFYTLLLTLVYSVLSYKTPWCILSFLHGWILLAAIGIAALIEAAKKNRTALLISVIVLLIPIVGTARIAHRSAHRFAADLRNPYVYAHTSPNFMRLVRRIGEIAALHPAGKKMYIQVVSPPDQTWPLPFYLRQYPTVGYWTAPDTVPKSPAPAIIISSVENDELLQPRLEENYLSEYYGLRADTLLVNHIRMDLWEAFLETRK